MGGYPGGTYNLSRGKNQCADQLTERWRFVFILGEETRYNFDDLLRRAEKYITLEEVRKAKKTEMKPSASEKNKALEIRHVDPEPIGGPTKLKSDKFCHFRNDYGHNTNGCFHLRDEIERLFKMDT
ncbi:hypothetical protein ACS0TY_023235 [Phlomoides rotata]